MNKKGQCGLRVSSSACTTPTVMKATKPCPPLAAYSSRFASEAQRSNPMPFAYQELQTGRRDLSCATSNKQGCCFCCVVFFFFYLTLAAPPTLALKGLTSLCGSRSLSCTDLINNFYQPLAQEISRGVGWGWVGVGGGGGVEGEDREGSGGGCEGGGGAETPGGRERAFDHVSATRDRGIHHD